MGSFIQKKEILKSTRIHGRDYWYYSLPLLEEKGLGPISKLPITIRIILESILRNCDEQKITEDDVRRLAAWKPHNRNQGEIPFVVSRILLQDFTGVPLLVDLAAMRDAVVAEGKDANLVEPLVPVDLVIDHSVQVDKFGTQFAFQENLAMDLERNYERYAFLKWGQEAFKTFHVIPPGIGIVHQVNLEYLAKGVFQKEVDGKRILYPDTLVGTDSHTTMINGLGIVGWGVGGIEAEAGMLGQPIYIQIPEVIGVHLIGELKEGVTATDLTLYMTQLLRGERVVGKFVEFFGEGAAQLSVPDRATLANMAPEYGATMGFFSIDEKSLEYLTMTGRSAEEIECVKVYFSAQGMFGIPRKGDIAYSKELEVDLRGINPAVSGPKRPQDRIELPNLKEKFYDLLEEAVSRGGYGKKRIPQKVSGWRDGDIAIASITSCTNTSNPSVMVAAGLLARNAVQRGLSVNTNKIKTSFAPGSRVVTDYYKKMGLYPYLEALGFHLVGYGCTTCIGNSGPLDEAIDSVIRENEIIAVSVLSGNRNFEARVHPSLKANFLMSPPLVIAFAIAGRIDFDMEKEPLGKDRGGQDVYLKDLWPSEKEIDRFILENMEPSLFTRRYADVDTANAEWNAIRIRGQATYDWEKDSTYIQKPPFLEHFDMQVGRIEPIFRMRPLLLLGDSVTTDHISPAGAIAADGAAGRYLMGRGVHLKNFNSFGARRGNDRVMMRGTFANVQIKNRMADGREGGYTKLMPEYQMMSIFEASEIYAERKEPLIVFGGSDYGMGSSRDWAAKGTALLGVKVVVAKSFERIHRSNLIGMGVLPLEFLPNEDIKIWDIEGSEVFSLYDLNDDLKPLSEVNLEMVRYNGKKEIIKLRVRIDTSIEIDYYRHKGILPYVLRDLMGNKNH